jgi:hypothetical protein
MDVRDLGVGRQFDIIMYVLYSGDQIFIKSMVTKATLEVVEETECHELKTVLNHDDNLLLYKCLFFLMLDFNREFRYWVLKDDNDLGLIPICPQKALRFLRVLRDEIVPNFLVNETMRLDDFERNIKVEYIRS